MTSSNKCSERWLPIPGWEGWYDVSNVGRVRSVDRVIQTSHGHSRRTPGRLLRPFAFTGGHLFVSLSKPGIYRTKAKSVHRLVLTAFVGECPEGMECCHEDGDKENNRVENLYWGTRSQNMKDRFRHGWLGTRTVVRLRRFGDNHCPKGHELTPANSRPLKYGNFPKCRRCHVQEQREYLERKRAAKLSATHKPEGAAS